LWLVLLIVSGSVHGTEPIVIDIGSKHLSPTREVVTPHISWANPYYLGKLRVLFMGLRLSMREVIEIAQRLEIDYDFWGANGCKGDSVLKEGRLRFGYYKGDEPGDKKRRLEALLKDREYDLIVIGSVDWRDLPLSARYNILRQVKNGAGLMNIGRSCNHDTYLSRARRNKTAVPQSVAAGVPWKMLPVFSRYKDTADFLSSTLDARQFGKGRIVTLRGYEVPDLHLISPGFSAKPLTGHWFDWWQTRSPEYKAQRPEYDMPVTDIRMLDYDYYLAFLIKVMLFAAQKEPAVTVWGAASPVPMETGRPRPSGLIHEVDREDLSEITFTVTSSDPPQPTSLTADFVLRDVDNRVFAASSRPDVSLKPGENVLSFPLSNVPAGDYFADLWIKRDGQVVSFGSTALKITSKTFIRQVRLDRAYFEVKEQVAGSVEIERGPLQIGDLNLVVTQQDNFGRLVRRASIDVEKGTVRFSLRPIPGPLTVYQYLYVALLSGDTAIDTKRLAFTYSNLHLNDTIRVGLWHTLKNSYIHIREYEQYYKMGFDYTGGFWGSDSFKRNYYGLGPGSNFKAGRFEIPMLANLRYIPPCARMTYAGDGNFPVGTFLDKDGKEPLLSVMKEDVRYPCFNDPKYRAAMRKRVVDVVRHHSKASIREYFFDQDMIFSFPRINAPGLRKELCFCPHCMAYFQNYLREQYVSIEAVNKEYGTDHKGLDDVIPPKLVEAQQSRKLWPIWADFRMATDSSYSDFYAMLTDAMRAVQPDARTGNTTLASTGFTSDHEDTGDIWKMSRWTRIHNTYGTPTDRLWLDFALPELLASSSCYFGPFNAYQHTKEYGNMMPWYQLFRGDNLFYLTNSEGPTYHSLLSSDLSLYGVLKPLVDQLQEIKQGIGKLIHEANRDTSNDVAVLYSTASNYHWILTTGCRSGDMQLNNLAWVIMLSDCNLPFKFISYEQLANDILAREDFKVLVLLRAQALSPAETQAIKTFVERGGTVLADLRPGVSDGHCRAYGKSPLDEVFGVVQNTAEPDLGEIPVEVPFSHDGKPETLGSVLSDCSLALGKGRAAGAGKDGIPVLVRNQYGKGKSILFNFSFDQYVVFWGGNQYCIPAYRSVGAPRFMAFFKHLLPATGLRSFVTSSPELNDLRCRVFSSGTIKYVFLLPEFPEPLMNYAAGTAKPLQQKKTTISFEVPRHVYDAREKRYLGLSNQISAYFKQGVAKVYSLLPYMVRGVSVTARATVNQGDVLAYKVDIAATGTPEKHVLNVSLVDPEGTAIRCYTGNVSCTGGKYAGRMRLALNEKPGIYQIVVTDAGTGKQGKADVEVKVRTG